MKRSSTTDERFYLYLFSKNRLFLIEKGDKIGNIKNPHNLSSIQDFISAEDEPYKRMINNTFGSGFFRKE